MKTISKILILSASMAFAQRFINPKAPKPVRAIAPTEQSLREEMRHERLQRQYKNASLAASKVYKRQGCNISLAEPTGRVAVEYGLSPRVLAALVFIESSCNPDAVSKRDGVGLMQVNVKVWPYTTIELKNPERNLCIGASILASYVHRFGLIEGLHRYNGLGNPTNEYAEKVLAVAGIQVS